MQRVSTIRIIKQHAIAEKQLASTKFNLHKRHIIDFPIEGYIYFGRPLSNLFEFRKQSDFQMGDKEAYKSLHKHIKNNTKFSKLNLFLGPCGTCYHLGFKNALKNDMKLAMDTRVPYATSFKHMTEFTNQVSKDDIDNFKEFMELVGYTKPEDQEPLFYTDMFIG